MTITLNGTTGITSPGGDTSTSLATGGLSIGGVSLGAGNATRFKNRIINGDMRIDQRNAGASVTPVNAGYTLDRWFFSLSQASKLTCQQNAGSVTPPAGFTNYLGITSTSAYSLAAGDFFQLYQHIEGLNVADLGWGTANAKTVTLSFWVRSSLTGTFGGVINNAAVNRVYPFSYTISSANTWTQISVTIAGDTTGTWLTTNGVGIQVRFSLGMGSTYTGGTAGAWTTSLIYPNSNSIVSTNGATFYITGVQLEVGSNATGFEYVDYGTQLAMCQRYARYVPFGTLGRVVNTTSIAFFPTYPEMRTSPTVSFTTGSLVCDNGSASATAASPSFTISATTSPDGSRIFVNGFSGLTTGDIFPPQTNNRILLSSEL